MSRSPFEIFRGHFFPTHAGGAGGSHVHGDFPHERLEVVRAGHEVRFAVHLDEDAHLAAGVDVLTDHALGGRTPGPL